MPSLVAISLLICTTSAAAEEQSRFETAKKAVVFELKRYGRDARDLASQPLRWDRHQWSRFAEGTAAVAALYAADRHLYDQAQRHRSATTDDFAKAITPFGGRRALDISALMILGGVWSRNANMRDAGRDSLEAELWAAGVVTPLLKRTFGRARPSQDQGARSFHPFGSGRESFPSGHATNAFAFATGVASHYDNWIVPAVVYSIATGVVLSRINDRAHFPSDVLAGALIGRAVAKGIVARHAGNKTTWQIVPILDHRQTGLIVRFISR